MKATRLTAAALIVGGIWGLRVAQAQKPVIGRAELARGNLGDSVREVIQTRVDFPPAAAFSRTPTVANSTAIAQ